MRWSTWSTHNRRVTVAWQPQSGTGVSEPRDEQRARSGTLIPREIERRFACGSARQMARALAEHGSPRCAPTIERSREEVVWPRRSAATACTSWSTELAEEATGMSDDHRHRQTILLQIADATRAARARARSRARADVPRGAGHSAHRGQESAIAAPLAAAVGDAHDMLQLAAELIAAIEADDTGAIIAKSAGLIQKIVGLIQSIDAVVTGVHGLGLAIPASDDRRDSRAAVQSSAGPRAGGGCRASTSFSSFWASWSGSDSTRTRPTRTIRPSRSRHSTSAALGDWFQSPATVLRDALRVERPRIHGSRVARAAWRAARRPRRARSSSTPPRSRRSSTSCWSTSRRRPTSRPRVSSSTLRSDFNTGTHEVRRRRLEDRGQARLRAAVHQLARSSSRRGLTFIPPPRREHVRGRRDAEVHCRPHRRDRRLRPARAARRQPPRGAQVRGRRWAAVPPGTGPRRTAHSASGGAVTGGKLAISFDEADGFIGKLLSGVHLESDFDFGLGYSTDHGLYFIGVEHARDPAAAAPRSRPGRDQRAHLLGRDPGPEVSRRHLAADIKAALGPLQVVVEQIGLEVDFALKDDRSGNAGPLDISLGFKPPRGAGLSIDAGLVKGGGYLFFDPDKGEYAGVAELSIAEIVTRQGRSA